MTTTPVRRPVAWGRVVVLSVLLAEVAAAFAIGAAIGAGWTLLALAVLSLLGFWVLVREGRTALTAFARGATGAPADPSEGRGAAPDTATGVAAGLLLLVPGFLTGLTGLVLLIPPVRHRVGRRVVAQVSRRAAVRRTGDVVVGEIVVTDVTVSDVEEPGTQRAPGSQSGLTDH